MTKINTIKILTAALLLSTLGSCARQISSSAYDSVSIGEVAETYYGVVESARSVEVAPEQLQDNQHGQIAGGLGGAILGSKIAKGSDIGTLAGAVVGSLAGSMAEQKLKTQKGVEYIVRLEDGSFKTLVQGPSPIIGIGQSVFLHVYKNGRSRVVASNA